MQTFAASSTTALSKTSVTSVDVNIKAKQLDSRLSPRMTIDGN
jgi:hypothetical protein